MNSPAQKSIKGVCEWVDGALAGDKKAEETLRDFLCGCMEECPVDALVRFATLSIQIRVEDLAKDTAEISRN